MTPRTVCVIDPSIHQGGRWDINTGDEYIFEAVRRVLEEKCHLRIGARVPSLIRLTRDHMRAMAECDYVVVAGTNLLSSRMNRNPQWVIGLRDMLRLRNVVLLGVGWWQYQPPPNWYTQFLLRRVLHARLWHSVRDDYSEGQLRLAGITSVLNTACPTMWEITPELQKSIPTDKADDVVTTVTCYNQRIDEDHAFLTLLRKNYATVYLWPASPEDENYGLRLLPSAKLIPGGRAAFDAFLAGDRCVDYIGTRLHAGIRAIEKRKRALVLSVDNRAREIARDTNLNAVERNDIDAIHHWIPSRYRTDIRLPAGNIEKWIAQFRD